MNSHISLTFWLLCNGKDEYKGEFVKKHRDGFFSDIEAGRVFCCKAIHMLFLLKSTILSYTWLLLSVEVQFCNFQRGGIEDFTVNVQLL